MPAHPTNPSHPASSHHLVPGTRYSPLATRSSLLAPRYSLLAPRSSLLATRYSPPAARYSLLTTRYPLLSATPSQLRRLVARRLVPRLVLDRDARARPRRAPRFRCRGACPSNLATSYSLLATRCSLLTVLGGGGGQHFCCGRETWFESECDFRRF